MMDDGPCGVCIGGGDGENGPEFCSDQNVKARKSHTCCECGDIIQKGAAYNSASGKWDGEMSTYRTCLPCDEIRRALCCDGWTYTMLWEEFESGAAEALTTGCLEQLTTAAAKAKLLEKWREWKGLV